ncbi:MAG: phage tail protein [Bacteroidetes bacterium]|nr:MAG: phage tail protein [Bacteroidota bacterium]
MTIGLITEGITDQVVLEHILIGYFGEEPDFIYNQPLRDATDVAKQGSMGGWAQVLAYCASGALKEGFQFVDYYVIQIDTDTAHEYGISQQAQAEMMREAVKQKIIDVIGEELYTLYHARLFFAVCVNALECWLLPLYASGKRKGATSNCFVTIQYPQGEKNNCCKLLIFNEMY